MMVLPRSQQAGTRQHRAPPASAATHTPSIQGEERQRDINTLLEGLGHLALRRHRRHPWGPGEQRGERQGWGWDGDGDGSRDGGRNSNRDGATFLGEHRAPSSTGISPPTLLLLPVPIFPSNRPLSCLPPFPPQRPHSQPHLPKPPRCPSRADPTHLLALLARLPQGTGPTSVSLRARRKR